MFNKRKVIMKQPKRIDFNKNHFECTSGGGSRKYYFHDTLSVARYEVFEELEMMVAQGRSFADVYNSQKKIHELLNQSKVADAAIENYNSMKMVREKLENRFHPCIRLVALFANEENEDVSIVDDVVMERKMNDWKTEGYAHNDFFQLAFNLVDGMLKAYDEVSQMSLKQTKEKETSKPSKESVKSSGQD